MEPLICAPQNSDGLIRTTPTVVVFRAARQLARYPDRIGARGDQRKDQAMTKQQTKPVTVASAQATLTALEQKRQRLIGRAAELAEQRRSAAYAYHVQHDSAARVALDKAGHRQEPRSPRPQGMGYA
jgi:hypothetical protein